MRTYDVLNWITEVQPIIRKSASVEEGLLKFAEDKNLAPAQLEKLAHIINAGATTTFLEKNAETNTRGADFKIIDVPNLIEDYSKGIFKKSKCKNKKKMQRYQNASNIINVKKPSKKEKEALVDNEKTANNKLLLDTIRKKELSHNIRQLDDLKDAVESAYEKYKTAFLNKFKSVDTLEEYHDCEADTLLHFGKEAQSVLDHMYNLLSKAQKLNIKRASSAGRRRLIRKTAFVEIADAFKTLLEEKKIINDLLTKYASTLGNTSVRQNPNKNIENMFLDFGSATPQAKPLAMHPDVILEDTAHGIASGFFEPRYTFDKNIEKAVGKSIKEIPKLTKNLYDEHMQDLDKSIVDATDAAKYQSILTELMLTDDLLSEEDDMDVANKYQSLINLSPELAKDINYVKVYLRSAIQHDGLDVFTAKQLADAEYTAKRRQHIPDYKNVANADNKKQIEVNINNPNPNNSNRQ